MTDTYPQELQGLAARFAPGWPVHFEIGEGWYPLLIELERTLADIAPHFVVHQVKSKFGALRFYAQPSDDPWEFDQTFTDAIRAAEWQSLTVCEECGLPGRQYVLNLWVSTLCPAHHASAAQTLE